MYIKHVAKKHGLVRNETACIYLFGMIEGCLILGGYNVAFPVTFVGLNPSH